MSERKSLFAIRNVRTGIILPSRKYGHAFLTFDSRDKAGAWIAAQKPDLPYEEFEVVLAGETDDF